MKLDKVVSGKFGRPRSTSDERARMDLFDRLASSDDDWVRQGQYVAVKCWSDPHRYEIIVAKIDWTSDEQEVE